MQRMYILCIDVINRHFGINNGLCTKITDYLKEYGKDNTGLHIERQKTQEKRQRNQNEDGKT